MSFLEIEGLKRISPETVDPQKYRQFLESQSMLGYNPGASRRLRAIDFPWPDNEYRVTARLLIRDLEREFCPPLPEKSLVLHYGFSANKHVRRYFVPQVMQHVANPYKMDLTTAAQRSIDRYNQMEQIYQSAEVENIDQFIKWLQDWTKEKYQAVKGGYVGFATAHHLDSAQYLALSKSTVNLSKDVIILPSDVIISEVYNRVFRFPYFWQRWDLHEFPEEVERDLQAREKEFIESAHLIIDGEPIPLIKRVGQKKEYANLSQLLGTASPGSVVDLYLKDRIIQLRYLPIPSGFDVPKICLIEPQEHDVREMAKQSQYDRDSWIVVLAKKTHTTLVGAFLMANFPNPHIHYVDPAVGPYPGYYGLENCWKAQVGETKFNVVTLDSNVDGETRNLQDSNSRLVLPKEITMKVVGYVGVDVKETGTSFTQKRLRVHQEIFPCYPVEATVYDLSSFINLFNKIKREV